MSRAGLLRRFSPLIVLGTVIGCAHALPPQAVEPVTLPQGRGGVDGPFFPQNRVPAVLPSTGASLQQQAQQRVEAQLGANTALSNGASITKAQAQSSGLGYVAEHFDAIDTGHTGRVSMSDVRAYLQKQQAPQ